VRRVFVLDDDGDYDTSRGAAKGMYISSPGLPVERLGERGRRFVREFAATQPGWPVDAIAVYAVPAPFPRTRAR
jgi:hypothetical protein